MPAVAVLGAGAAGIAAARVLHAAVPGVVVFEARDRVGGRILTDYGFARHPVELGAEFIHGQYVVTWEWVRALGFHTIDDAHHAEQWTHYRGRLMDAGQFREAAGADLRAEARAATRAWIEATRPDASMAQLFDAWTPFGGHTLNAEDRALLDNYIAQGTATDPAHLSIYRGTQATYHGDGDRRHFRVREGQGALVQHAAAGLDIRLGTPVTRVQWDERGAAVEAGGTVTRFDRVVVALPLGVLKRAEALFDPPLPAPQRSAITALNAGHIAKIVLKFDEVHWPPDMTFLWTPLDTQLWWRPGEGRADEEPILTAFFGGDDAARLEGAPPQDAVAWGVQQLETILGRSLAGTVRDARYLSWGAEPFTAMGYSSLPPGGLGLRARLAAPAGALTFAGEATSLVRPATVHGAIESGRRAAAEVLASL